jgi:Sulfotransferase family
VAAPKTIDLEHDPWSSVDETTQYDLLVQMRLRHLVRVREPLVVISQVDRSGGTLLNQLFDSHPEVHTHPPELKPGTPKPDHWRPLDLDTPDEWFATLRETTVLRYLVQHGYRNIGTGTVDPDAHDVFRFTFLPHLQKQIFEECVAERPVESERDVWNAYFTSYFNAWLDNGNLDTGPKRLTLGFTPRLNMDPVSVEQLFTVYPDGALISIVRDPRSWYASARVEKKKHRELEQGLGNWRRSTEAAIGAQDHYGADRVLIVTYEELVLETEAAMSHLAGALGISMSDVLLRPTFNGQSIRADSSHPVERHGILADRADSYRRLLDPETISQVEELAGDAYEQAAARSVTQS